MKLNESPMKKLYCMLLAFATMLLPLHGAFAHHNTQAEFGAFDSPTIYVEGKISRVQWGNPHIAIEFVVSGGDIPVGEKWRVASHPVQIQVDHGFAKEDFKEGDTIRMHAWKHVRGTPQVWPRAIQINDGPMRSNMRFADMIDIAKGTFTQMNMTAAANLNGSPVVRAGEQYVSKLKEMGLVDDKGNMVWPAP